MGDAGAGRQVFAHERAVKPFSSRSFGQMAYPLLLAILAAASFWVADRFTPKTSVTLSSPNMPDFVIESPTLNVYGEDGGLRQRLIAKKMEQYTSAEESELQEPRLVEFRDGAEHARLSSLRAHVFQKLKKADFMGDAAVEMARAGGGWARLDSDRLTAYFEEKRVVSDTPVVITAKEGKAWAEKAEFNYERRTARLVGDVRSVFLPPR